MLVLRLSRISRFDHSFTALTDGDIEAAVMYYGNDEKRLMTYLWLNVQNGRISECRANELLRSFTRNGGQLKERMR